MPNSVKEMFSSGSLLAFKACSYAQNRNYLKEKFKIGWSLVKEHFLFTFIEACSSLFFLLYHIFKRFFVKSIIRDSAGTFLLSVSLGNVAPFQRKMKSREIFVQNLFCLAYLWKGFVNVRVILIWFIFKIANDSVTIITRFPWPYLRQTQIQNDRWLLRFQIPPALLYATNRDLVHMRRRRWGRRRLLKNLFLSSVCIWRHIYCL